MVFNVTKDNIKVRMSSINEDIWPLPSITEKRAANPNDRGGFTPFLLDGRMVYDDVLKFYYDQANEMIGTEFDSPR